jgi:hypothetical protein
MHNLYKLSLLKTPFGAGLFRLRFIVEVAVELRIKFRVIGSNSDSNSRCWSSIHAKKHEPVRSCRSLLDCNGFNALGCHVRDDWVVSA